MDYLVGLFPVQITHEALEVRVALGIDLADEQDVFLLGQYPAAVHDVGVLLHDSGGTVALVLKVFLVLVQLVLESEIPQVTVEPSSATVDIIVLAGVVTGEIFDETGRVYHRRIDLVRGKLVAHHYVLDLGHHLEGDLFGRHRSASCQKCADVSFYVPYGTGNLSAFRKSVQIAVQRTPVDFEIVL